MFSPSELILTLSVFWHEFRILLLSRRDHFHFGNLEKNVLQRDVINQVTLWHSKLKVVLLLATVSGFLFYLIKISWKPLFKRDREPLLRVFVFREQRRARFVYASSPQNRQTY